MSGRMMTKLDALQVRWLRLHGKLRRDNRWKDSLALAPFFSVPSLASSSILYVGKATSKDGCAERALDSGPLYKWIRNGQCDTMRCMKDMATTRNPSAFWRLAKE